MHRSTRVPASGLLAVFLAASLALVGPVVAFDLPAPSSPPSWSDHSVLEALRQGARAYYAGDKEEALDGLQSAAAGGHPAAQWKLGRMYADGDGVAEDDIKAFEYFNEIISAHGDDAPTSPQAPFVANAFVEIGSYYVTGIGKQLKPNAGRAREIFTYAASYFGDAMAQVNLARMYLDGIGGERDPRQAARWLLLAARKGQVDAQVKLGEMLTSGEEIEPNPVHGLMWLTVALKQVQRSGLGDEAGVRSAHEAAFAMASEDVRRRADSLADQWIADNPPLLAATAAGPGN